MVFVDESTPPCYHTKGKFHFSFLACTHYLHPSTMAEELFVHEKEKIMISDLIFFVQNKLETLAHDDIVDICEKFYTDEAVKNEKERFFMAVGKKITHACQVNKKWKDLNNLRNEAE